MVAMATIDSVSVTAEGELLPGVLLNRFQHAKAGLIGGLTGEVDQAVVDQPRQPVEHVIDRWTGNRLGRRECEAAGEDTQPLKQVPLCRTQEVDAPGDGVSQRLMPL